MTTTRRPSIALLAAPETSASVLYGLYDVLLSVGPMWPDMIGAEPADALLEVSIVAASAKPFRCFGNILVEPHAAVVEVDRVDAVVVCDMYTPIDKPPRGRFAVEIDWLRRMHSRGALLTTVCTGSLMLAEAGMLNGRSCAGHWAYRDLFQSAYPRIRFGPGAILDLSSEGDGLITAGGVTAWHDLALHLIARFCGPEHASRTAKVYLLAGHEDGQLPFSAMTRRVPTDDAVIRDCLAWIADNYAIPNPVTAMTERSGLTQPDVRAPLPGGDWLPADRLRARAKDRGRAPAPRDGTRWGRRRGLFGGLRGPDLLPPALQANDGHDAGRLPAEVRAARRGG